MDIPAIAKNAVATAFRICESVTTDCVYHRVTPGAYDPSLGANADSETTKAIAPIFGVYAQKDVDGTNIRSGDKRIMIQASEMAAIGTPQSDDFITETASGERWDIIDISYDVTRCLWVIQGRTHPK